MFYLARCINAAYSDGKLFLGEYYGIGPTVPMRMKMIGPPRVAVVPIPDSNMRLENFCVLPEGLPLQSTAATWDDKEDFPEFNESRFEMVTEKSLPQAIHIAQQRLVFSQGKR